MFAGNNTPSAAANLTVTFSSQLNQHNQVRLCSTDLLVSRGFGSSFLPGAGAVFIIGKMHPANRQTSNNTEPLHSLLDLEISFYALNICVSQMASTGGQSLSLSSNVPLLNYQPGLYQQATINIPGLAQQGVPLQTRSTQLCTQTEPFQQTLIVCPPTIQGEKTGRQCRVVSPPLTLILLRLLLTGLQTSNKPSTYPVRMDNSVPLVPQNQSSQPLQIQPGMLSQVRDPRCEHRRFQGLETSTGSS